MSILPTSAIGSQASRSVQSRGKSNFVMPGISGTIAESVSPAALSSDTFLFLQEVEAPEERDARSRQHGGDVLGLLAELQRALLEGETAADAIASLTKLAGGAPVAASPALQAAVDEISLRAHVELARSEILSKRRRPSEPGMT